MRKSLAYYMGGGGLEPLHFRKFQNCHFIEFSLIWNLFCEWYWNKLFEAALFQFLLYLKNRPKFLLSFFHSELGTISNKIHFRVFYFFVRDQTNYVVAVWMFPLEQTILIGRWLYSLLQWSKWATDTCHALNWL